MSYAVDVREDRPAGAVVIGHALCARYQTLESAARVARGAALRHARARGCDVQFRVLGERDQLATGGVVRARWAREEFAF